MGAVGLGGPEPDAPARAYGVFVGIDRYVNLPEDKQLGGAANDARRLSEAFAPALAAPPVVLSDDEATRANVLSQIEKALETLEPGDLFILFCACHGQSEYGEFFLWPHDHDRRRFLATALLFRDVANAMTKPGVMTLMIIDACQSGAVGFDPAKYEHGGSSSMMVASGPLESSKERPEVKGGPKYGVFAYGLSLELQKIFGEGGAGEGTITEIFRGAYDFTKENAWNQQHPALVGTLPADLKIGRADHPASP